MPAFNNPPPAAPSMQVPKTVPGGVTVKAIILEVTPPLGKGPWNYRVLPLEPAALATVRGEPKTKKGANAELTALRDGVAAAEPATPAVQDAAYELAPFVRSEFVKIFLTGADAKDKQASLCLGAAVELISTHREPYTDKNGVDKLSIRAMDARALPKPAFEFFSQSAPEELPFADFQTGEPYADGGDTYARTSLPIENDAAALEALGKQPAIWCGQLLLADTLLPTQFIRTTLEGKEQLAFHDGVGALGAPSAPRIRAFFKRASDAESDGKNILFLYGGYESDWRVFQLNVADWQRIGPLLLPAAKGVASFYVKREKTAALTLPTGYQAAAVVHTDMVWDAPAMVERAGAEVPAADVTKLIGDLASLRSDCPEAGLAHPTLLNLMTVDASAAKLVQTPGARFFVLAAMPAAELAKIKAMPIDARATAFLDYKYENDNPHFAVYAVAPAVRSLLEPASKKPKRG